MASPCRESSNIRISRRDSDMAQKQMLFVVRKFIRASSIKEVLNIERDTRPDEVYIDPDWKRQQEEDSDKKVGFKS